MREELADATTARTLTLLAKALQTAGNLGSADLTLKVGKSAAYRFNCLPCFYY